MTIRLSTGLAKFLAGGGSLRAALNDFVADIYTSTRPTYADSAPNGTKLWRITKDSATWSASTTQKDSITITSATAAQTQIVTIDSVVSTYVNPTSTSTTAVATAVAAMINTAYPHVFAISSGPVVYTEEKCAGAGYALSISGTGNPTTASVTANAAGNGLRWIAPTTDSGGVYLPKQDVTWSGVGLAAGNASWLRLKAADDDDAYSATAHRLDLACATANTDFQMSSVACAVGIPNQIVMFNLRVPQ